MFINGIKYVGLDQKVQAYKFGLSTGRFRNIVCFHGLPEEIHRYKAALLYALLGIEAADINQAIIYLSDDNGDHWIIDRNRQRKKIFKNKKEITNGGEEALKRALLEWGATDSNVDETAVIEMADLQFIGHEWVGQKFAVGQSLSRDELRQKLEKRFQQELQELRKFLGLSPEIDLQSIRLFMQVALPAFQSLSTYRQQLASITKDFAVEGLSEGLEFGRLEDEVKLLDRLSEAAQPLLDPAKSPVVAKERYQKVEQDIEAIISRLGYTELPKFHEDIDWGRLIGLLARYQAFERLEQTYRKMVARADNSLRPILEHFIESMRSFLKQDRKILTELEKSLNVVTHCVLEASPQPETNRKGFLGLLDKMTENRDATVLSDEKREEILTHSRESVNSVLCRLGELHSNFEIASQKFDEGFDEVYQRHEKIVKELSVTKEMWLKSAKSLNIDPNSSIKNLLGLIREMSQLSNLDQERQRLRKQLSDYRIALRQLEEVLAEWYRITGSQKSQDLSQASILLREIKGVLSYRDQKEKQLDKLRKHRVRLEAFQAIEKRFTAQLSQAEQAWSEAFSYLALPAAKLDDGRDWEGFFRLGQQILVISDLAERFQAATKAQELFASLTLEVPLTIFQMPRQSNVGPRRNAFLSALETASPHGYAMILCSDPLLAEALLKMGVVCSQSVEIKKKTEDEAKSAASTEAMLLTDRARAALELFQGKGPRNF